MQLKTIQSATSDESPKKLLSIRVRLLIVTSSVILLFVMILITLDYRREIRHHFHEKQADLMDEARTVLPAVLHLQDHGGEAIQKYIDSICVRMDAETSPDHHIAVKVGGDSYLQTSNSKSVSNELLDSMLVASDGSELQNHFQNEDLLYAVHAEGNVQVIVSENVAQLRSAVLSDEVFRLLGIGLMGIIADAVVNLLLVRLIGQPLESLANQVRLVGNGDFGARSPSFSTRELNELSSEINLMSETLAASDLDRRSRLQKARDIQQNLLPHDVEIPGVNIAITYIPAEEVGGDYLDILPLEQNRWLVCIADATGHGVPAAMTAAMLKTLLLQASERFDSPGEILREMNRVFMRVQIFGDFASLILIEVDLENQALCYANAGHDPAWLIASDGTAQEFTATGTLLGIVEDATWDEEVVELTENCRLAISTDGITETFGADDDMFSKERLLETLLSCQSRSVTETNDHARQLVDVHRGSGEQTDDVTLLLMEFELHGRSDRVASKKLHEVVRKAFQRSNV